MPRRAAETHRPGTCYKLNLSRLHDYYKSEVSLNRSGESRKHVIVNYQVNARYPTAHVKGNQSKRH